MNLSATMRIGVSGALNPLRAVKSALGGVGGALKGLGGMMMNPLAGLIGGMTVGTAAVLGFKKAITEAANMESLLASFEVMLGSMENAKALMTDLNAAAAETPFELPELGAATKMLIAFGSAQSEVIGELRSIGDIASGVGAGIGEIAEIYGKARVQGRLFAEDINQLTGRGIPIIGELAKQFGVADSQVKGLVESGAIGFANIQRAFGAMTSEGGRFFGMMDKQSKTWSGLMSTLQDEINAVFRAFGTPVIDGLKPLLTGSIGIAQQLQATAQSWGEGLRDVLTTSTQLFANGQLGEAAGLALRVGFADATAYLGSKLSEIFSGLGGGNFLKGLKAQFQGLSLVISAAITDGITTGMEGMKILGQDVLSKDQAEERRRLSGINRDSADDMLSNGFRMMMGSLTNSGFAAGLTKDAETARGDLATLIHGAQEQMRSAQGVADWQASLQQGTGAAGEAKGDAAAGAGALGKGAKDAIESDRLAKIGLFAGGSGPQVELARRTARFTEQTARSLQTLIYRARPASGGGAATFA